MKRQYDFSHGVRGKFYRKGAELRLPIYLDAKLQSQLERISQKKGKQIGEVVNQLVKKEVQLLEDQGNPIIRPIPHATPLGPPLPSESTPPRQPRQQP